jgi:hypothetical protein
MADFPVAAVRGVGLVNAAPEDIYLKTVFIRNKWSLLKRNGVLRIERILSSPRNMETRRK